MSHEGRDETVLAKFWRTPEMVANLLSFLDGSSTLNLARCHDLTKSTVQQTSVWPKVVTRLCPVGRNQPNWDEKTLVATNKKELMPLLDLLRMTKDPAQMKLTLLEVICRKFPPETMKDRDMAGETYPQYVKVRFSSPQQDHSVSAVGFLLLEEVEMACRSSPNLKIDKFDLSELEGPMLMALSRRASKKEPMKQVHVWAPGWGGGTITCNYINQAEALLKIVKCSEDTNFEGQLNVGEVKKKGWAALGKVADLLGDGDAGWLAGRTLNVVSRRDHMLEADREDLRKIWKAMHGGDALDTGNWWSVTSYWRPDLFFLKNEDDGLFEKAGGDEEWERLLGVLDMSENEWNGKWERRRW